MTTVFSPAQLKTIVDQTLPLVPAGRTNAVVGTVDKTGAQVLVTFKSKDEKWLATGVARHEWTGENEVGASLIYSWQ